MRHRIKDLMSRHVIVASTHHKFSQVLEFFAKFHVHHIPVTENDEVLGIISAKDVIRHFYNYLKRNNFCVDLAELDEEVPLSKIMTERPITIGPDESLDKAAELFTTKKFHCLPVVLDGKVNGIITTKDIAKEVLLRR